MGSDSKIDGRDVIYEIEVTPETHCAGQHADVPDAFRVVALPDNENCGLMVYSLYHGEWMANCNPRWLIRHLLEELKRLQAVVDERTEAARHITCCLGGAGDSSSGRWDRKAVRNLFAHVCRTWPWCDPRKDAGT